MDVVFWTIGVLWLLGASRRLFDVVALRRLPEPIEHSELTMPTVSVMVPARDEEARIETTIRRLLAQRGMNLHIIAVDDRSRDRTGAILRFPKALAGAAFLSSMWLIAALGPFTGSW